MNAPASQNPSPPISIALPLGLILAAACIAGYLLIQAEILKGVPLGCGGDSGCGAVLKSSWSKVLGIPVTIPALLMHSLAVCGLLLIRRQSEDSPSSEFPRAAVALCALVAISLLTAAGWFIAIQIFLIGELCPWCLIDHALGIAAAVAILRLLFLLGRKTIQQKNRPIVEVFKPLFLGAVAGLCGVTTLAAVQMFIPSSSDVVRLPAGQNADSGPGSSRQIAVLDGKLTLNPHEVPTLGDPDAPKLIVLLYDYSCPHCRAMHHALKAIQTDHQNQFAIVMLPMPLNADCNPHVEETEPRFVASCELAQLALAVWRIDKTKFPEYDFWLFDPEMPRTADAAKAEAERLIGSAALSEALADPWINNLITSNVTAYHESEQETIPILLSPHMDGIVGRNDEATLRELLETELKL